jgi:anthranilate synthase component 1/para-aminobenzoate synthetase
MAHKPANAVVPLIIAVDGRSGVGKTTLAVELTTLLREHHTVSLFHLEDIYPGWDGLVDGMDRYVSTVLTPLASGLPARWTAWDWTANDDGDTRLTQPSDIVVVEGVGAACEAARELLDVVVWLDADEDVRRSSALTRDGETYATFWQRWSDQEERWLSADNPAPHADLLVQGHLGYAVPDQLRRALTGLPQCESLMSMERAARRGLTVQVETLESAPEAAAVFHELFGASAAAAWLDRAAAASPCWLTTADGSARSRSTPAGRRWSPAVRSLRASRDRFSAGSTACGEDVPSVRPGATRARSSWAGSVTSAMN